MSSATYYSCLRLMFPNPDFESLELEPILLPVPQQPKTSTMECSLASIMENRSDLVSWVFGNQSYDQDRVIYIDAEQPERTITAKQARQMVKRLIAGLKAAGLRKGDCVCIHAFNDVSRPLSRKDQRGPLLLMPMLMLMLMLCCSAWPELLLGQGD